MASSSSSDVDEKTIQYMIKTYNKISKRYSKKNNLLWYNYAVDKSNLNDINGLFKELLKQNMVDTDLRVDVYFKNGFMSCKDDKNEMKRLQTQLFKYFEKSYQRKQINFNNIQFDVIPHFTTVLGIIDNDDGSESFVLYEVLKETEEQEEKYKRIVKYCDVKREMKDKYHDVLTQIVDEYTKNTLKNGIGSKISIDQDNLQCDNSCSFQHGIVSSSMNMTVGSDGNIDHEYIQLVLKSICRSFICSLIPLHPDKYDLKIINSSIDINSNHAQPTSTLFITSYHHILTTLKEQTQEKEDEQEKEEKCEKKVY